MNVRWLEWLGTIWNGTSVSLVTGALIAGLVGYGFSEFHTWRVAKRTRDSMREHWGGLFYNQLFMQGPEDDPISRDPPTVRLLNYTAIRHLLEPGVIDLDTELDLLDFINFFESVVEDYNYKARTYNSSWANGTDKYVQEACAKDFRMTNMDYQEQHPHMIEQVQRLYRPDPNAKMYQTGPVPISESDDQSVLRQVDQ